MDKIINKFYELPLGKRLIILLIVLFLLILIYVMAYFGNNKDYTREINYRRSNIEAIFEEYSEMNDRVVDLTIIRILDELNSNIKTHSDCEQYYKILNEDFKKNVSKSKFSANLYTMLKRTYNSNTSVRGSLLDTNNNYEIRKNDTYDNVYILRINVDENKYYVGFYLDYYTNKYSIFYLGEE